MQKVLFLVGVCLLTSCSFAIAQEQEANLPSENEMASTTIVKEDYSPQLIEKIKLQRETIYNALNLTPSQIQKKDEIDLRRYCALKEELKKMCVARRKVVGYASNQTAFTKSDVRAAKKEFDAAKRNVACISDKYDREFKKILNSEQKAKYSMIRKLKRSDLKKQQKIQSCQNRRNNSDLRPFGQPISQAAYTEQKKKENCIWNKLKRQK